MGRFVIVPLAKRGRGPPDRNERSRVRLVRWPLITGNSSPESRLITHGPASASTLKKRRTQAIAVTAEFGAKA